MARRTYAPLIVPFGQAGVPVELHVTRKPVPEMPWRQVLTVTAEANGEVAHLASVHRIDLAAFHALDEMAYFLMAADWGHLLAEPEYPADELWAGVQSVMRQRRGDGLLYAEVPTLGEFSRLNTIYAHLSGNFRELDSEGKEFGTWRTAESTLHAVQKGTYKAAHIWNDRPLMVSSTFMVWGSGGGCDPHPWRAQGYDIHSLDGLAMRTLMTPHGSVFLPGRKVF
jgi:hypothetical protein